jgi:hypothetical protein
MCLGDQVVNDVAAVREVLIDAVEAEHRYAVACEHVGIWIDQGVAMLDSFCVCEHRFDQVVEPAAVQRPLASGGHVDAVASDDGPK